GDDEHDRSLPPPAPRDSPGTDGAPGFRPRLYAHRLEHAEASMDLGLTGKRALIGGGGAGIGHGIATALAAEGATVALLGRTRDRVSKAAQTLGGHPIIADLATDDG